MKKTVAILLLLGMMAALGACSGVQDLAIEPLPTVEVSETPGDAPDTQEADAGDASLEQTAPEEAADLGGQVIVSIQNQAESFMAPDNNEQRILTFGYDTVQVHIDGNDAASEAINHLLAVESESFYIGSGEGDGLNGLLEQATDNYTIAHETGEDRNLEFSASRTASVARSDSRVLSLVFSTYTYVGGAHGNQYDRANVFDTTTGEPLSLAALTSDYDAFSHYLIERMKEQAQAENSGVDLVMIEDLDTVLGMLLRDGSWYLDRDGLVIFSDLYEISSYAAGMIRFAFSYEELAPYLSEKWLPVPRSGEGSFTIARMSEVPSDEAPILDRVIVHGDGEELYLRASGTVYDVEIVSVNYVDDSTRFYVTAERWSCSYLRDSAVQIVTVIPEGMPDLMIRYYDAHGAQHRLLLTESGVDGSLILTDDSIEAVG